MINVKTVLSIQSHVAYGYVGNRAAVLPLQAMGHEIITVNTVQLSNHTGYGDFKGDFFSEEHISSVLQGVEDRGVFPQIDAVLTGYLGNPDLGDLVLSTIEKIKTCSEKDVLYICDPVMGDVGRGFFVKDELPPFFKEKAAQKSDILTPNQFELEFLAGQDIKDVDDALNACKTMHDKGVKQVLLTSLEVSTTPQGFIQMLLSTSHNGAYVITTPKLEFNIPLNGSGDTTAALFGGYILAGDCEKLALEKTAAAIYGVFEDTKKFDRRELALIQNLRKFSEPEIFFKAAQI
jgi:pyridoxine kinase